MWSVIKYFFISIVSGLILTIPILFFYWSADKKQDYTFIDLLIYIALLLIFIIAMNGIGLLLEEMKLKNEKIVLPVIIAFALLVYYLSYLCIGVKDAGPFALFVIFLSIVAIAGKGCFNIHFWLFLLLICSFYSSLLFSYIAPFNFIDNSCGKNQEFVLMRVFLKESIDYFRYNAPPKNNKFSNNIEEFCGHYKDGVEWAKQKSKVDYNDNIVNSMIFDIIYTQYLCKRWDIGEVECKRMRNEINENLNGYLFPDDNMLNP